MVVFVMFDVEQFKLSCLIADVETHETFVQLKKFFGTRENADIIQLKN